MVIHIMREGDVIEVLTNPLSIVRSDPWVMPPKGEPHPRFFGAFPRVIRRYVKELKVLSLEEAVRRISFGQRRSSGLRIADTCCLGLERIWSCLTLRG